MKKIYIDIQYDENIEEGNYQCERIADKIEVKSSSQTMIYDPEEFIDLLYDFLIEEVLIYDDTVSYVFTLGKYSCTYEHNRMKV